MFIYDSRERITDANRTTMRITDMYSSKDCFLLVSILFMDNLPLTYSQCDLKSKYARLYYITVCAICQLYCDKKERLEKASLFAKR